MHEVRVEEDVVDDDAEVLAAQAEVHLPPRDAREEREAGEERVEEPGADGQLLLVLLAELVEVVAGLALQDGLADPAEVQEGEDDAEGEEGQEAGGARVQEGLDPGHVAVPELHRLGAHVGPQLPGVHLTVGGPGDGKKTGQTDPRTWDTRTQSHHT